MYKNENKEKYGYVQKKVMGMSMYGNGNENGNENVSKTNEKTRQKK